MDRRVLTTCLACFLFTLLYWKIFAPPPIDDPGAGQPAYSETDPGSDGPASANGNGAANPAGPPDVADPNGPNAGNALSIVAGTHDATDVGPVEIPPLENDNLRVKVTNLGAAVRQAWLKKHWLEADARAEGLSGEEHWISLFPYEQTFGDALAMTEFVTRGADPKYFLDRVHWAVEDETDNAGVRKLSFTYATNDGLEFLKRLTLGPDDHAVFVEVGVRTVESAPVGDNWQTVMLRATGGIEDVNRGWFTIEPQGVTMLLDNGQEATVEQQTASGLQGDPVEAAASGNQFVAFAGASNLYFGAMLAPRENRDVRSANLRADGEHAPLKIESSLVVPIPVSGDGAFRPIAFDFYLGPKDPKLLEELGLTVFQPLIEQDYGSWETFRWINKFLLMVMLFFHDFTGNWGVAIILLTLMVRMGMFPITRTQQVSMQRYSQKMQVLKPKLDALKAKYKDKPQKFAQEQMKLLKEHNAKPPLLGCISIFITFPIFIAMFQILRTSIDLRQAPFGAWIHDLALPDAMFDIPGTEWTFNLLPILATVAFVGQMMMAPKPADPQAQQQQKIMYFMPLLFGVMFYGYAAGLSLYMLTSSMWGMFEYKFIRAKFFPNPPGAETPGTAVVKK